MKQLTDDFEQGNNALGNWELYKYKGFWYWEVWDDVNHCWWTSDPFEDYQEASIARDGMMADTYRDETETE